MVKRKTGSFENQNFVSVDESYYTFTSQDKINWKISDSTKQFQHYKLQKATAYWGGRN
jgi:GLPGLI family protein